MPIIALTAHARKEAEQRCVSAGMDAHFSKPLDSRRLVELSQQIAAG